MGNWRIQIPLLLKNLKTYSLNIPMSAIKVYSSPSIRRLTRFGHKITIRCFLFTHLKPYKRVVCRAFECEILRE